MTIHQFYDKNLAHASYAILSNGEVALVDPGRDPQPYYTFAQNHGAKITKVFETHPHADFVSSHFQIHKEKGAGIYVHQDLGAGYPHIKVGDGEVVPLGAVTIRVLYTPGHSPDSISLVAVNEAGKDEAVFTGDSLFIGDCGRPDLRENAGNLTARREELARMMYHTLHHRFLKLGDDVKVYPAHGAGSLCGKNLSDQLSSTIGVERVSNWSMQEMSEDDFVKALLEGQPFIPKYFGYDVRLNKDGAPDLKPDFAWIPVVAYQPGWKPDVLVVDARPASKFRSGHMPGALNVPYSATDKFETWVGAVVAPDEKFYLVVEEESSRKAALARLASIGYDALVKGVMVVSEMEGVISSELEHDAFEDAYGNYVIIDIRQEGEHAAGPVFSHAVNIPLSELRERVKEVNGEAPVVVHCAGGYRSAIGTSILERAFPGRHVYDLGNRIKTWMERMPLSA